MNRKEGIVSVKGRGHE